VVVYKDMVGLGGLARWVTLQHYFGTTLLKGCRPLLYRRSYACLYMQSVTLDNRQRGDRRCWIFRERGSVPFTSLYSFCVRILLTIIEEVCGNSSPRLADRRHMW